MKLRNVISAFMLAALIFTITACGKQEKAYYFTDDITQSDSFYIKAEKAQYELGGDWNKIINLDVQKGEYDYLKTDGFDVMEKKVNDEWVIVAKVDFIYDANENNEHFTCLDSFVEYSTDDENYNIPKYNFEKGNYRVIREYHNTDDSKGLLFYVYVGAEFELV